MTKRYVLLKALGSMPADVERLLNGIDPVEARLQKSDHWSVPDILLHLDDTERRYLAQLQDVVYKEQPALAALRIEEPDPELDRPFGELFDLFKQARAKTLDFLIGLSPGDWQRKAVHETLGETSLRFLVQHLVDHDTQYLGQLVGARQRLRTPSRVSPRLTEMNPIPTVSSGDPRVRPLIRSKPILVGEEKHGRRRTRKWPRK